MLIIYFRLWFFEAVNDFKFIVLVRGKKKFRGRGLLVIDVGIVIFLNVNRNEFNKKRYNDGFIKVTFFYIMGFLF